MAGRIRIEPYKPLDVHTPPVPGSGYIQVDANAGKFSPSPLAQLGLQAAEGVPAIASEIAQQLARDDEAVVKDTDARLGETEQALLFDPQTGYFNSEGQEALNQAPVVLDAYRQAQEREAESAANEEQRRMLEDLAQRRLTTFSEQVERHSTTERQRWYDTTSDRRIALMQADAGLNWSDDALLRRALGTVRAEVRDKAEHHAWPSTLTEATLREQTSRTLVSAIEAAVERDPERAHSLRTRYEQHIESHHRIPLDALLTEAQARQRAQLAIAEILNATPPDGQTPTQQWHLQQAEAIAEPAVRAATLRTLHAAAAATEARSRTLAEQVLARVLKDSLTDPSQIPVREWVTLDTERRQAIETRIDHNAAGTEPAPNPALVDELATQMTKAPADFARRDLLPSVARLPLPQWHRFRELQAGTRRNDPTTADELYAIKRGLQIAQKTLPADTPDDVATNYRAELVEEIDTWRRITGKSPDDTDIAGMLARRTPPAPYAIHTLEWNPRDQSDLRQNLSGDTNRMGGRMGPLVRRIIRGAAATGRFALWASEPEIADVAAALGFKAVQTVPSRINNKRGLPFYYNRETGQYITPSPYALGYWVLFDALGRFIGVYSESLDTVIPRDQLPADLVKEWTTPVPFPADDPPEPPTGLIPPTLPKWQEGFTVVPPAPPLPGLSFPEIDVPLIVTSDDLSDEFQKYIGERWERHHVFPRQWWKLDGPDRVSFGPQAMKFFDKQLIFVPKSQHWGGLHSKYNEAIGKALEKYLADKSPEYIKNMDEAKAKECMDEVIKIVQTEGSPEAKEFLERTRKLDAMRKSFIPLEQVK